MTDNFDDLRELLCGARKEGMPDDLADRWQALIDEVDKLRRFCGEFIWKEENPEEEYWLLTVQWWARQSDPAIFSNTVWKGKLSEYLLKYDGNQSGFGRIESHCIVFAHPISGEEYIKLKDKY